MLAAVRICCEAPAARRTARTDNIADQGFLHRRAICVAPGEKQRADERRGDGRA